MSQLRAPTVVVGDSYRLFLESFDYLVDREALVVGATSCGQELLSLIETLKPDLVVFDLAMPRTGGFESIRRIRALPGAPQVIILTAHCSAAHVRDAFDAGARGFVSKGCAVDDLRTAIRVVASGGSYRSAMVDPTVSSPDGAHSDIERLTRREREVLALIASGLTAREIGQRLGITERTVAFHKDRMKERLGVPTTVELVRLLARSDASFP
ncbi:MAG: hypothetical protein RL625_467 [Gemmatimonadota bacterium]